MATQPPARDPGRPEDQTELDLGEVTARVERKLAAQPWDEQRLSYLGVGARLPAIDRKTESVAEVAAFALDLSGQRRAARRRGGVPRAVAHFTIAATLAFTTLLSSGCDIFDGGDSTPAIQVESLPTVPGISATLTAAPADVPQRFTDLVLLNPGNDTVRWALMAPMSQLAAGAPAANVTPVLVDRQGAEMTLVGGIYTVPGQPIKLGTRDGSSIFIDPVAPAIAQSGTYSGTPATIETQLTERWKTDERLLAAQRAIVGQPTVMDAAYNAAAAAAAGGTHTYNNGVVLRVEPDSPVLQVMDRALLESTTPTRPEDMVMVAIRPADRSLYQPGTVVNLTNVVMQPQEIDVEGSKQTVHIANAAFDGARAAPAGMMNLQDALNRRLQLTDADLAIQGEELANTELASMAPTQPTPAAATTGTPQPTQTPVVRTQTVYRGPSFVNDMLMFYWLSNSGFYRGGTTVINNPPGSATRPQGDYYYTPAPARDAPAAPNTGTQSRSTVLQSARNAVSGQAGGTGGGTAATAKAASDATARVSAATSKAATAASSVSSAAVGKSAPAASTTAASSSAARSAGSSTSSTASKSSVRSSGGFGGIGGSSSS